MIESYSEVRKRYEAYREAVRISTKNRLTYSDTHKIELCAINHKALVQAKYWSFGWEKEYTKSLKHPQRFELAIWHSGILQSLSLGRPSIGKTHMRLDLIERSNTSSLLSGRAFTITELALTLYARTLGAKEIRIIDPINDTVKNFYVSNGYTYTQTTGKKNEPSYCWKIL